MITVFVALITAASVTIPNLINNHMNNKQAIKLKKMEIYEISKKDAVLEFSNCAISCISQPKKDSIKYSKFLQSAYNLFFYFPQYSDEINRFILDVDEYFENNEILECLHRDLADIISLMSKSTTGIW